MCSLISINADQTAHPFLVPQSLKSRRDDGNNLSDDFSSLRKIRKIKRREFWNTGCLVTLTLSPVTSSETRGKFIGPNTSRFIVALILATFRQIYRLQVLTFC